MAPGRIKDDEVEAVVTVGMSRSLSYTKLSSAATFKSHSCHSSMSADSPSKSKWERGAVWTILFTAISGAALMSTLLAVGIVSCLRSSQSQTHGSFKSPLARRAPLPGDIDIDAIRLYPGEDIDVRDSSWLSRLRDSASPVAGPSVAGKPRKPMVVLVTGAGGFVGSHLALALKQRGDGVIGLDNFNDYYETSLKHARADRLRAAGIEVLQADINNSSVLSLLFSRISFTHVAHLAAQAGVRYAMKNPQSYVHSNVAGFVTLLEACKRATPVPAIVWASSSSVYGLNKKVPFSETHRTERPASLYAATKLAGEALAHSYNHIHGLSLTALRFFTVYGPWGRPDMAYFAFTKRIMEGKGINVFVGANKTQVARDFTFIEDIIQGCLSALDTAQPSTTGRTGKKHRPAPLRVFNLGNRKPVSVLELVTTLEKHLGVAATRRYVRLPRNGDVPFTHANVSRAESELNYQPRTELDRGIGEFVKWYLEYYGKKGGKGKARRTGRGGGRKNREATQRHP